MAANREGKVQQDARERAFNADSDMLTCAEEKNRMVFSELYEKISLIMQRISRRQN